MEHIEKEARGFKLLFVKIPGTDAIRMYVSQDGEMYCHYDTGQFDSLEEAAETGVRHFDPGVFFLFPLTPFKKEDVIKDAPHAFDLVKKN
ncbi:MAG: hypothetical protein QMD08_08115 [Actinomycetota bacterium]|nr:hypothetical protein [Actinomycetota bacterium]